MKQEKRNILNSITKRWVAVFCIVCMLASVCFNEALVSAEETTTETQVVTEAEHTNELATEYAQWTLSDVGVEDATNVTSVTQSDASVGEESLDKTIFNAKINFSEYTGDFGRFFIGGKDNETGFMFRNANKETDNLRLQIKYTHPVTGESYQQTIADFKSTDTIGLRGNANLSVSLSVDYVDEYTIAGVDYVELKIGVFFEGECFGYYTMTDPIPSSDTDIRELLVVPKEVLRQRVYVTPKNSQQYSIASEYLWEEQNELPVSEGWEYWTLSDFALEEQVKEASATNQTVAPNISLGSSLDKTVFSAIINSPTTASDSQTRFYIGGTSSQKGIALRNIGAAGTNFQLNFHGSDNTYTYVIDSAVAPTSDVSALRGEEIAVSISVEYTNRETIEADGGAKLKIGIFFNGKLYKYYTTGKRASDNTEMEIIVPTAQLSKYIYCQGYNGYSIDSHHLWARDFEEAELKEDGYDYWTVSDLETSDTYKDSDSTYYTTCGTPLSRSLDKTIFTAKMNFDASSSTGRRAIGGTKDGNYGFVFRDGNANNIVLGLRDNDVSFYQYITLKPEIAGVVLRNNPNLIMSISVDYEAPSNNTYGYANLKVGLFFNGKRYIDNSGDNGTWTYSEGYYIIENVPTDDLGQDIYCYSTETGRDITANYLWTRELETEGWDYWTLSDVGIGNETVESGTPNEDGNLQTVQKQSPSIASSLDRTVFSAIINSPTTASDTNTRFYIGGTGGQTGIALRNTGGSGKNFELRLHYTDDEGNATNKNILTVPTSTTDTAKNVLHPTLAGTTLRGADLKVSISVEYLNRDTLEKDGKAQLKIGVFFNGQLYNNQYCTTFNDGTAIEIPTSQLSKCIYFQGANGWTMASNYDVIPQLPSEKEVVTFSDFEVAEKAYQNQATEMEVKAYGTGTSAFEHLVVSGEYLFEGTAPAYMNFGGADSTTGFRLYHEVTDGGATGNLILATVDGKNIATINPDVAGTTLVGEAVHIDISSQFVAMENDGLHDDLKLGIYFNGVLYDQTYLYYTDYVTDELFGNYLGFYADEGGKIRVASDRSKYRDVVSVYDLVNGAYPLRSEDEIEVIKKGQLTGERYPSESTLTVPGEYEISQYKGIYKDNMNIYLTSDANTDGTVDIRDLVSVKKAQNDTDAGKELPTIKALSVDSNSNGEINVEEVKNVAKRLLEDESSVAALCYETGVMPIGGYFGPSNIQENGNGALQVCDTLNEKVFSLIKDAGVNLIVETNVKESKTPDQLLQALSLAEEKGIGMYINADNVKAMDGITPNVLTKELEEYSKYASFKGLYLVDEPNVAELYGQDGHEDLGMYQNIATVLHQNTNHLGWANLLPKKDDLNLSSNLEIDESYEQYLRDYVDAYQPRFLSFDQYVWGESLTAILNQSDENKMYFSALTAVKTVAEEAKIPFWTFIQAGSNWNDAKSTELEKKTEYTVPSEGQLLWNVNTSLAYGAKGLTYFPLVQPYYFAWSANNEFDYTRNGLIGATGSPTQWYTLAQKANQQVARVDEVLMKASSIRLLAEGGYAQEETGITNDFSNLSVNSIGIDENTILSTEYGAVVGVFDYYGKEAYYVVNYDYMAAREVTLNFASSKSYKVLAEDSNCTSTKGEGSGESCTLSLTAGGAALVVVE